MISPQIRRKIAPFLQPTLDDLCAQLRLATSTIEKLTVKPFTCVQTTMHVARCPIVISTPRLVRPRVTREARTAVFVTSERETTSSRADRQRSNVEMSSRNSAFATTPPPATARRCTYQHACARCGGPHRACANQCSSNNDQGRST